MSDLDCAPAQTRWRSKVAKAELRRRRAEARESGKLLQDKQALERRLGELQGVLETVQNQRNELKQQFKVRAVTTRTLVSSLTMHWPHPALRTWVNMRRLTCRRREQQRRQQRRAQTQPAPRRKQRSQLSGRASARRARRRRPRERRLRKRSRSSSWPWPRYVPYRRDALHQLNMALDAKSDVSGAMLMLASTHRLG